MNNRVILTLVIIAILVAGGVFYYTVTKDNEPAVVSNTQSADITADAEPTPTEATPTPTVVTPTPTPTRASDELKGTYSGEPGTDGPDVSVFSVDYDGKAFSPKSLSIKVGDIVFFKNSSTKTFWPASDPHPTHTKYPEFDAKSAIAAGSTFQFKFIKVGTWGYHDHLNPSATGIIIVTK